MAHEAEKAIGGAGGMGEATQGNIPVLMTKNFLLKKRMWTKVVFGFFPAMLFMELIVPPGLLIGLTWVKMEAPLYMKTTGYGGWPVCNENELNPCTETTPIECVAGDVGQIDVAGVAARAGVANAATEAAAEVDVISTCESNANFVFQPDPFFYTLVALHWARDGGPKLALTAEKPEDIEKVRRFQQWVSQNWYPEQYMSEIPCADLELRDKQTQWEIEDQREQMAQSGGYVMCAEEELERFRVKAAACWCDGRVKMGTAGDAARDVGEYWTEWRNNTGYVECSVDVFGNPNPDRDPNDDHEYYVCLCDPSPEPVVREEGEWTNEGCTMTKCRDHGNDCCAPQAFREVARCSDGYVPHWVAPCAGMVGDGRYTCCPPPAGAGGPGACHFQEDRSGTISSFSQVTEVYESRVAMERHMKSPEYGAGNLWGYDILGAIIFSKMPGDGSPGTAGDWEYSLMLNDSAIWGVYWKRNVSRGWKQYQDLDEYSVRYDQSRFHTLQALVDRYVIHQRNNDPNFDVERGLDAMFATSNRVGKRTWPDENGWNRDAANQTYLMEPQMWIPQYVQFAALPIMGFRITLFYYYCDFALALLFILIYMDNMYTTVTTFIAEKETRMREVLRIQGVSTFEFIASWFFSYVVQFAALNLIIACVCVFPPIGTTGFGGIFSASSLLAVWWFLFLYSMSFVAKGFTIACFFGKARIGGMISLIIYLSGWFIQAALKYQPSSATSKSLLAFASPVGAFAFGVELLSKLEEAGAGATWENLDFRPDGATGLSFGEVLWLMSYQFIFYCLLGWYFDQVVPSQWGIKEKPWFFLTGEYWTRHSKAPAATNANDNGKAGLELHDNPVAPGVHIDDETVEMQQMRKDHKCIDIQQLRKTFPTPDGEFVAVNGLNMTMYEGQIFSLLGHNGAGKTTTISMLTGMLPPTAGDAYVYGKSILGDMPGVRKDIGFCPQHDVLYASLTVHEHLSMFASLKGVPDSEVEGLVMSKIADVGLTEKVHYKAGGLSGGQKRKLSLAMALIGDCKAIFLDEPTSGMDPYSRRSTWNMLQAARAGRVMVLTTHFMDEADILGDRIGIMAKGQLRCCGSSLFLKAQYGGGYNLAFAKTSTDPAQALQNAITRHVSGAKVISNIGTELKCQLPLAQVGEFPALFAELEANQQQFGFESYGIGLTNMEEVFLRVAEEGEVEQSDLSNDAEEEGDLVDYKPACQNCAQSVLNSSTFKDGDPSWYRAGSSFIKHLVAMYIKRARYGFRDRRAQICNTITPILLLWFGFFLMYDLLGVFLERDLPEVTLDLNIVKDELHLDSLPVPYNSTFPQMRPGASKFPGGVIAKAEDIEFGPEDRELYGVMYNNGKPLGEESCTMEPRQMLAFSDQLLQEGMGSEGEDVVYGAVMFPAEVADCCADYELPCAQVQQIMVTGLGLDCETEIQQLASPGGFEFMQERIGARGPVIANLLGLADDAEAGTVQQQLDTLMQQGADGAALFINVASLLGVDELTTASLMDFCPGQCAGEEFGHWNTRGTLAAMIRNRYRVCDFAKRAMDNGNVPIRTLVNVLQSTGVMQTRVDTSREILGCETTPIQLAEQAAPLVLALGACVRSFVCASALNAAMSLYSADVGPEELFMLIGGLNQTAAVMTSFGMGDLMLAQACPDTCGYCNRTVRAPSSPNQVAPKPVGPAPAPSRPTRSPSSSLPPCVDDESACNGVRNGLCEERHIDAPCESTHSCNCPAGSDATDCANLRGDCAARPGSGRRMQNSNAPAPPPVTKLTILFNNSFTHSTPVFASLGSNVLKNQIGSGGSIVVRGTMCPWTDWQKYHSDASAFIGIFQSLVVCLFIIIAFSFIPGALVEFTVREREYNKNAKHQQYVSGASIPAYWFGAYLWDLTMITLPIAATLLLSAWFDVGPLVRGDAPWCCFVIFLGYGLAICPFTYFMGNIYASSAKAQIYTILFNLMTGIVLMVASYILGQFYKTRDINEVLMWFYRIFPGFCLGHGLLQIFINNNEVTAAMSAGMFGGSDDMEEPTMFDWNIAGKDILYLYVSAVVYMVLVLSHDFLASYPALDKKLHDMLPGSNSQIEAVQEVASQIEFDEDVNAEAERVASGRADNDVVKLHNLQKVYPGGKMAVKKISVGIPLGECFGLLGINGAGKTSTLKILSGDQLPTAGTAHVGGMNVLENQRAVRTLIGYCPQFDALLDLLTVREHLELFSRIKNVPEADIDASVDAALNRMDLMRYANKLAGALSGGNKRKLCVAMAIMGKPKVVFLDEPSTGVDPVARRFMWDIISEICADDGETTVILTTHNMEECEALCTRLGIMVGGYMRCLGSITHLRDRFGQGYQLEIKLRYPPAALIETFARSRGFDVVPATVKPVEIAGLCERLGDKARADSINENDPGGSTIHNAMQANGSTSGEFLIGWFILQDYTATLKAFMAREFGGVLLEQHEQNFRFNVPSEHLTLSQIFSRIEAARTGAGEQTGAGGQLEIQEYAVSQTTLEQVFNGFAAQQEEEQGPIRGVEQVGHAPTEVPHDDDV